VGATAPFAPAPWFTSGSLGIEGIPCCCCCNTFDTCFG
jgi:hypothetical protein